MHISCKNLNLKHLLSYTWCDLFPDLLQLRQNSLLGGGRVAFSMPFITYYRVVALSLK
jgi:hypothetical protein